MGISWTQVFPGSAFVFLGFSFVFQIFQIFLLWVKANPGETFDECNW